jgi:hypothetical protein
VLRGLRAERIDAPPSLERRDEPAALALDAPSFERMS